MDDEISDGEVKLIKAAKRERISRSSSESLERSNVTHFSAAIRGSSVNSSLFKGSKAV